MVRPRGSQITFSTPRRAFEARPPPARRPVGIAVRVELHGASDHDRALAVDVDASALVDHRRPEDFGAGERRGKRADVLLVLPDAELLLSPAVEPPQHRAESTVGMRHERRAAVRNQHSSIKVSWMITDGSTQLPRPRCRRRLADQRHRLEASDRVGDRGPYLAVLAELTVGIVPNVVLAGGTPSRCARGASHSGGIENPSEAARWSWPTSSHRKYRRLRETESAGSL